MGVLFLRSAAKGMLSSREMDFCRIVANATAIALRNARVMQSLRDQTQKVNYARFEAERRLRALKRYANLFTSAADGLAAVDTEGKMLFANPRAYEIAGVSDDEARGHYLRKLVHPHDHKTLLDIWRRVRESDYPRGVDLRILVPHPRHNDVRVIGWAARSYYDEVLGTGGRIFEYERGMLHAKLLIVDDICALGSANMDIRSFHINYEVTGMFYDPEITGALAEVFSEDLEGASEVKLEDRADPSLKTRLLESGARVLSPLL